MVVLRGMGMGAFDLLPGVSGGTIAFITGIYEELVMSIRSVNAGLLRVLREQGFATAWARVNGNFLLALGSGILISIFSLARLMSWVLELYPLQVWAFFFGLIAGSAVFIGKKIRRRTPLALLFLILGTVLAYYVTIATPASPPETLWFVFLSGSIALCAMILPGISGAFILILLGMYETMLQAAGQLNIPVIAVFALGGVAGLIAFANLIGWLFRTHPNATLALLSGFMIGSLNKLWPWKKVLETRIGRLGEEIPVVEQNITPWRWASLHGEDPRVLAVLLMAAAGLALIFVLNAMFKTPDGASYPRQ